MTHRYNTDTGQLIKDTGDLGVYFYSDTWRLATQDEIDLYLLQEAKNNKIAEIKKAKNETLYLPVDYNGNSFHTSEKANINILGVIGIMEDLNLPAYPWRSLSGQVVNLTLTDFKQLRRLIGSGRGSSYSKEADRTIAVMTAKSIKEVNNIKW